MIRLPTSGFIYNGNNNPSVIKDTIPELEASVAHAFTQKDFYVGSADLSNFQYNLLMKLLTIGLLVGLLKIVVSDLNYIVNYLHIIIIN